MPMFEFLRYESPDSWILLESRNSPIERKEDDDSDCGGGGTQQPADRPTRAASEERLSRVARRAVLTATALAAVAALLAAVPHDRSWLRRRHQRVLASASPMRHDQP